MDRWLLEHDCDGEIYTLPTTDEPAIERVIGMFDGRSTFYCCLSDNTDESCLWCVGEPGFRLIEGEINHGGKLRHFVLHHRFCADRDISPVRHYVGPDDAVAVAPHEVFTPAEALSIFLAFHRRRAFPSNCEMVDGERLFGSSSSGT